MDDNVGVLQNAGLRYTVIINIVSEGDDTGVMDSPCSSAKVT